MVQSAGSLLVLVAMNAELVHLLDHATAAATRDDGIWSDHHLTVEGRPVVACRTDMGMVAAAAATERALNRHRPAAVLNYGCAGAHRHDIQPGDVVIGTQTVQHANVNILTTGEDVLKPIAYTVAGEKVRVAALACDADLVAAAKAVANDWTPEPWPLALDSTASDHVPTVHAGVVASADVWTQSHARIALLHERHNSLCEDMEAAAIAQVCAMHDVPFLTVKDISNNELLAETDLIGFSGFPKTEVGKRAAALARRLIARYPVRPPSD